MDFRSRRLLPSPTRPCVNGAWFKQAKVQRMHRAAGPGVWFAGIINEHHEDLLRKGATAVSVDPYVKQNTDMATVDARAAYP